GGRGGSREGQGKKGSRSCRGSRRAGGGFRSCFRCRWGCGSGSCGSGSRSEGAAAGKDLHGLKSCVLRTGKGVAHDLGAREVGKKIVPFPGIVVAKGPPLVLTSPRGDGETSMGVREGGHQAMVPCGDKIETVVGG